MSSPPKKMRKSAAGGSGGGGASGGPNDSVSAAPAEAEPIANENNDIEMDDDLDPAAMYEDEEGEHKTHFVTTKFLVFLLTFFFCFRA